MHDWVGTSFSTDAPSVTASDCRRLLRTAVEVRLMNTLHRPLKW